MRLHQVKNIIKSTVKNIAKNKKVLSILGGALIIFLAAVHSAFFGLNITEKDIPNYAELKADSYKMRKEMISGRGIADLIRSSQFKKLEYQEKEVERRKYQGRNNPFKKPF